MKLGSVSNLVVIPDGADPILGRIERAAELGLHCLGVWFRADSDNWKDTDYLQRVRDLAAQKGIILRSSGGTNFYLEGAEVQRLIEQTAERLIQINRYAGIDVFSITSGPMLETHRWVDMGKTIPERLAHLAVNMGTLADLVAPSGITLALENHCDYRGHEIAEIIRQANRPNLKVQIDTGNAFSVFEEPVDCAKALAPYVVSSHFKDVHVTPFAPAPCRGSRVVSVPLGEGHTDNLTICKILQEQAPDPKNLTLLIEPFYLPDEIPPQEFLARSVAWARKTLTEFLD